MRDILFKGKAKYENGSIKKGDWVYGDLIRVNGITKIYNDELGYVDVNPETVGQFTGLYDKNGKRIFEGDILKRDRYRHTKIVEYNKGCFYPFVAFPEWTCWYAGQCAVVGNAHDNPELLEVK